MGAVGKLGARISFQSHPVLRRLAVTLSVAGCETPAWVG